MFLPLVNIPDNFHKIIFKMESRKFTVTKARFCLLQEILTVRKDYISAKKKTNKKIWWNKKNLSWTNVINLRNRSDIINASKSDMSKNSPECTFSKMLRCRAFKSIPISYKVFKKCLYGEIWSSPQFFWSL